MTPSRRPDDLPVFGQEDTAPRRAFGLVVRHEDGPPETVQLTAYGELDSGLTMSVWGARDEQEQAVGTVALFMGALVDDDGLPVGYEPADEDEPDPRLADETQWSSRRRIAAILDDPKRQVTLRALSKLAEWLMEGAVDLPTGPPRRSSPGQASTGPMSRAARR